MKIKFFKYVILITSFTITKNVWLSNVYASEHKKHDHHHSTKDDNKHDSKKTDSTNQELNATKKNNEDDVADFGKNIKNYKHKLVLISNDNKNLLNFKIAIADNYKKREQGLMNIKKLPEDHAMLFIFDNPQIAGFWMKNTLIPLDIIFVDQSNKIVNIAKNNKPLSENLISSKYEIDKTIEVNAGIVDKYQIKIGDKISFK